MSQTRADAFAARVFLAVALVLAGVLIARPPAACPPAPAMPRMPAELPA